MQSVHIDMNITEWLFSVFHRVGDLRAAAWCWPVSTGLTRRSTPPLNFTPDKYNCSHIPSHSCISLCCWCCFFAPTHFVSYCGCFCSRVEGPLYSSPAALNGLWQSTCLRPPRAVGNHIIFYFQTYVVEMNLKLVEIARNILNEKISFHRFYMLYFISHIAP